ncbi:PREDICTED: uncharacterized protein LOC105459590 [Wasmannia auropunctata]|uniref:uncharacterized protein LOC105459590 n=1 Tax=Wasmannia auropunctata TaxID=64793 RepID=UPI0005EDC10A|nr:PREDICTED: uncharacterized protein LOC105459590 [Wasmannia auropunctata]
MKHKTVVLKKGAQLRLRELQFRSHPFAVFLSTDYTVNLMLKVLSLSCVLLMYLIEYNACLFNYHNMKRSLEQLQDVCNELQDEIEIEIMRKYGENGRRYSLKLLLFQLFNMFSISSLPFMLYIFDVVLFTNEYHPSSVIRMLLPKYLVGRENYYYLVLLYMLLASGIGGTAAIATGMLWIVYLKHICGMLRIASYRIEKAMAINTLNNASLKNESIICKEIIQAVDIHQKAVKSMMSFSSSFGQSRFVLLVLSVIALSINLYEISEAMLLEDSTQDLFMHSVIVFAIFIFLFLSNYAGQDFTDHNNHIFSTV